MAVKLAHEAIKVFGRDSIKIDTLASAYAETGDYQKAVYYQKKAIKMLTREKEEEQLENFKTRLNCYLNKIGWRDYS